MGKDNNQLGGSVSLYRDGLRKDWNATCYLENISIDII